MDNPVDADAFMSTFLASNDTLLARWNERRDLGRQVISEYRETLGILAEHDGLTPETDVLDSEGKEKPPRDGG